MVDMYVVGKTNEAKISLMYNLRFFKRWRRKWKRKKKRIKKIAEVEKLSVATKSQADPAYVACFLQKRYRTSSRAMQIRNNFWKYSRATQALLKSSDDIMVLDELVVSLESDAYVIMNKRIACS